MGDEFEFVDTVRDLWLKPFPDVFAAAWAGVLPAVEKFVSRDEEHAYAADETPLGGRNTALHYAASKGHSDVVEFLLSSRARYAKNPL